MQGNGGKGGGMASMLVAALWNDPVLGGGTKDDAGMGREQSNGGMGLTEELIRKGNAIGVRAGGRGTMDSRYPKQKGFLKGEKGCFAPNAGCGERGIATKRTERARFPP